MNQADIEAERDSLGTKYTMLELFFSNRWRWVRRRSKDFWVRQLPDGQWVKFSSKEIELLESYSIDFGKFSSPNFETEDWRFR